MPPNCHHLRSPESKAKTTENCTKMLHATTKLNHHTHIRKTFTPISVRVFWSNFHDWRMSSFCFVVCRNLVTIGALLWDFLLETVEAAHPIVELRLLKSDENTWVEYMYCIKKFPSCEIRCLSRSTQFKVSQGQD